MFRATVGDTAFVRFVTVTRDGLPVSVSSCSASIQPPSRGGTVDLVATVEGDAADGMVRVEWTDTVVGHWFDFDKPLGSQDTVEAGTWQLEVVVNGEHIEDPIPVDIRAEYVRGDR